jgi:hypothetical protein
MKPSINLFMLGGKVTFLTFKETKTKEEMVVMGLSVPKRRWQIRRDARASTVQVAISGFKEIVPYIKRHLEKGDIIEVTGEISSSAVRSSGKEKVFGMRVWLVARTIRPLFRGAAEPHPAEPWIGAYNRLNEPQTADSDPLLADDLS